METASKQHDGVTQTAGSFPVTQPIAERFADGGAIDRARFAADILPGGQPVVMRGLNAHWPAVQAAQTSRQAIADYLTRMDVTKQAVPVSVLPPEHRGRFFYNDDVTGYNFFVDKRSVSGVIDWLAENGERDDMVTVYIQALLLSVYMPQFEQDNVLDVLETSYGGRMWIGNAVRTQTHFDPSHNIACVVAGSRRFTLFPPEQIANLYPGPFDRAPGHVPVSMASIEAPDFERYPRFRDALAVAQTTVLEAGDALFIPYGWWHHVQSSPGLNVLVNYWWTEQGEQWVSPFLGLYNSILAIRDLPPEQKRIWRGIFDTYIFADDDAAIAHLPEGGRGVFGAITAEVRQRVIGIIRRLTEDMKP